MRSPSEFAEDHLPGAVEPSGARRRRARAHRHAARARFGVRREGAPARRSSRATSRRCSRRPLPAKPRDWAPLVYCWRGGQRSAFARPRAERNRLARRAARWRLSRLSTPRRRAPRGTAGTLSLRRRVRTHRIRQEPADRRARRRWSAGARPRSHGPPSRFAAGRPARRTRSRRRNRSTATSWQHSKHSTRRVRSMSSRRAGKSARCSSPTLCSPRCAAADCIRVVLAPSLRIELLKDEYAHFLADHDALVRAPRAPRSAPWQEDNRALDRRGQGGRLRRARRRAAHAALRSDVRALDRQELSAQRNRRRCRPVGAHRHGLPGVGARARGRGHGKPFRI